MSSLTSAVAAVITDAGGRVLLCQLSQGHRTWRLPGGKIRNSESPMHAVIRDVMEETGGTAEIIDLVGIYQLTGDACGDCVPDVLVHVFRGRMDVADVTLNAPGRLRRVAWYDPSSLPEPLAATAEIAIADAAAGLSGVLRDVQRHTEPEIPDAMEGIDGEPSVHSDPALGPLALTPRA